MYNLDWFEGLTKIFLNIKIPKILLLAGCERMDKELTIAQMQGKFKLCVINNVGHIIHEDNPTETYHIIDDFIKTFRIPAKVKDIKPIVGKLGNSSPVTKKYEEN
jgi:protein phosphatase methylesterase 1